MVLNSDVAVQMSLFLRPWRFKRQFFSVMSKFIHYSNWSRFPFGTVCFLYLLCYIHILLLFARNLNLSWESYQTVLSNNFFIDNRRSKATSKDRRPKNHKPWPRPRIFYRTEVIAYDRSMTISLQLQAFGSREWATRVISLCVSPQSVRSRFQKYPVLSKFIIWCCCMRCDLW